MLISDRNKYAFDYKKSSKRTPWDKNTLSLPLFWQRKLPNYGSQKVKASQIKLSV